MKAKRKWKNSVSANGVRQISSLRKGIAIATDTIIYIILGVTVLTVLLFFLTTNYAPVEDRVKLERDRAQFCDSYVRIDPDCDGRADTGERGVGDQSSLDSVKSKLDPVCTKLNVPAKCTGGGTTCLISNCCAVCPRK